jgi:hypothetical protein
MLGLPSGETTECSVHKVWITDDFRSHIGTKPLGSLPRIVLSQEIGRVGVCRRPIPLTATGSLGGPSPRRSEVGYSAPGLGRLGIDGSARGPRQQGNRQDSKRAKCDGKHNHCGTSRMLEHAVGD